ncbi:DnaB-like helicase C-terminal domain-containing protein [Priestia megaterium]|uniref:DnaB-like helicase C-terminal domain-containing protein n=1 Tax=Priestia megaterium TaxID=1404 RepID=UPI002FFF0282
MNQSGDKSLNKSKIQSVLSEIDYKQSLSGLPTGFVDLDRLLNGLQDGDLIVVGGKSIGKTSFVVNICANVATKTDACVTYFSLATKTEVIANRLVAAEGNININRIQRGKLTKDDWGKVSMSMGSLSTANLHISDNPILRVKDIEETIVALQETYPDVKHLIAVDYLSLLDTEGQQNRYEQTDFVVKKLKIMARTLNCPVILVVNLSRNYDRRIENSKLNTRPRLSDLRDSGTIEEDADVVILIHKDIVEYELDPELRYNVIDIIVEKHRNGPTGDLKLAFVREYSKFVNLEKRDEES